MECSVYYSTTDSSSYFIDWIKLQDLSQILRIAQWFMNPLPPSRTVYEEFCWLSIRCLFLSSASSTQICGEFCGGFSIVRVEFYKSVQGCIQFHEFTNVWSL